MANRPGPYELGRGRLDFIYTLHYLLHSSILLSLACFIRPNIMKIKLSKGIRGPALETPPSFKAASRLDTAGARLARSRRPISADRLESSLPGAAPANCQAGCDAALGSSRALPGKGRPHGRSKGSGQEPLRRKGPAQVGLYQSRMCACVCVCVCLCYAHTMCEAVST